MTSLSPLFHIAAAVAAFVGWAVVGLVALRLAGVDLKSGQRRFNKRSLALAGAINGLVMATVMAMQVWWDKRPLQAWGLATGPRHLVSGAMAVSVIFALSTGYALWLDRRGRVRLRWKSPDAAQFGVAGLVAMLVALFMAALQEEVVFRAYVLEQLHGSNWWAAVAVSAVVFTGVHFVTSRGGRWQAASWLVGGVFLAGVYLITGSVWVAAVVHFAHNLANVLVINDEQGLGVFAYDEPMSGAHKALHHALQAAAVVGLSWLVF